MQLGLGITNTNVNYFTRVTGSYTAIAAGWKHSLALSGTDLYVTGYNLSGQLGISPYVLSAAAFTRVPGQYAAIKAGRMHSMILSAVPINTIFSGIFTGPGPTGSSGITFTSAGPDTLGFTPLTPTGLPNTMNLYAGATNVANVLFDDAYVGQPFVFFRAATNAYYFNNFTIGNLNL